MTNEEILAEFEELFGGGEEPPEETDPEDKPEDGENPAEDTEGNEPSEGEEGAEGEGTEGTEDKRHSKQSQAFYALRKQNKAQEQLIKSLGSVLGFDANASNDDIVAKVQEAITQKQAKDQKIPVEILNRLQELEKQAEESETIKHEAKVTEDLTLLAERFNLDEKALTEFLLELNKQGKNPLEHDNINLQSEYISMYFDQLMENAKQEALADNQARKDKQDKAPGALPGKPGGEENTDTIKSVSDLDKLFNSMNI